MKTKESIKELNQKDVKQLAAELQKTSARLAELRNDLAFGKLKNFRAIRQTRTQIARINTILGNKAAEIIEKETETKPAEEATHA